MILKFKDYINENLNEGNAYDKGQKLDKNDQFLGRRSLSYTLSQELGLNPKNEFGGGDWLGFDDVSLYTSGGKKKGIILDDALVGDYTYQDLKKAAADFLGIKEAVNEGQMDWEDFGPDEIADKFAKDNAKNADGGDLENWLDMFAMDVGIEDRFHDSFVEEIIDALNSKGYRKIKIEDIDV